MWSSELIQGAGGPFRALLEAIVSNVDEGITVIDTSGRFVFVNDDAAAALGFASAAELMAAEPRAVADRYQVVDEKQQPLSLREMPPSQALLGQTPPEMMCGWRVGPTTLKWSLVRSVPLESDDGKVQLVITFFRDITARRQREADERFLATATAMLGQSLDVDSTLKSLASLAVPELSDWAVVELVEPTAPQAQPRRITVEHADPKQRERALEVAARWQRPWNPDSNTAIAYVLRTGQPRLVPKVDRAMLEASAMSPEHLDALLELGLASFLCVPLCSRANRVVGSLALLRGPHRPPFTEADQSFALEVCRRAGVAVENAQLYAAVETANRQKDAFLAMLGHELRNPLQPMVNALPLLDQPASARGARAVLERQLQQLGRLVDELLDVSRISRGKIDLQRQRLDLSALVRDVAADHAASFTAAGLTLDVQTNPAALWVDGDRVRLHQVLGNLLTNAAKFTPRGGSVSLTQREQRGRAVLEVRDTGAGLDAETIPRLFQPFVQVDRSLDRRRGGLGLGLAVVKGIVELHDGTVTAQSAGLGHGATFSVSLPISAAPAALAKAAPEKTPGARAQRVLVIDDNADLAHTMRDLLAFDGREVQVELSGLNAVEAIRRMRPDVVICDLGLPQKDGYAIAAEVRADPSLINIRLVALSGYGLEADQERALKAGFNLHLTKPVPPDELMSLVGDS